jgi:hypothetical protein
VDDRACSQDVAEHAGATVKADALAHSKWATGTAAQRLVHLDGCLLHLNRGTWRADPFGRLYGTVASGIITA